MSMEIGKVEKTKSLGRMDIFLGIICLVFFLDTIGPTAAMGPSVISWYLIVAAILFIPLALVTAELGSTYPDEGGVYSWVLRGMGRKWAARVSWFYWINNAIWLSSMTIFIIQVFAQLFLPNLSMTYIVILSVIAIWLFVFIAMRPLKESKWITNIGAIFKLLIVVGIFASAIVYLMKNGTPANDLSLKSFTPALGASFAFFPALVFNMMGFESISSMGSQMKNPGKDVPKAIVAAVFLLTVLYCLANLAMLVILPAEEMDIVQGLLNCFIFSWGTGGVATIIVMVVGLIFLATLISQVPIWIVSTCTVGAEAARNGELPQCFGKLHPKHQSPMGGLIIYGVIASVLTIIGGLLSGSGSELFWTLFSFTSIIFFIPYILNFNSFIKLRKNDKETVRPFRFPGPDGFAFFMCRLGQAVFVFTIITFFWVPGQPIDWAYTIPIVIGVIISIIVGEVLNRTSAKRVIEKK
ncbi:MAG: APC family permease [Clostridiales bacterium]